MLQRPNTEFQIVSRSASLAELLGAFSYALDLTEGQPAGHYGVFTVHGNGLLPGLQ